MKRSEMIKYLVGLLRMPRFSPVSDEILAEKILTALEGQGMMPPEIETPYWNRQDNDYHKAHEWEDENEEKQ